MNQLYRAVNGFLEDFIITLSQNRKFIIRHLLILFPATIYLGMICFIGKESPAESFIKSFQVFTFFIAGITQLYLAHRKIAVHRFHFLSESIMYTLFAAGVICITLLFFYLFTDNSMAGMAFTSGAAFALPYVCWQLLDVYKRIPRREHTLWTQPLTTDYSNEVLIPEVVSIQFLIVSEKKYREQIFFKVVPEGRKLGKAFYSVIKDNVSNKNSGLSYSDESGNLFAWEFYIKTMMGLSQRRLDPELSLYNNGVGHHPKLYVKRINISDNAVSPVQTIRYKAITESGSTYQSLDKQVLKLYSDNHKN